MIGFWIAYLVPLGLGLGIGWWARGQQLLDIYQEDSPA